MKPVRVEQLPFVSNVVRIEEIDSTNTHARQLLAGGYEAGRELTVVWAGRQRAGRGRHGRSFFSSVEGGLWVSVIVPVGEIAQHFCVNRALSLAICDSLRAIAPAAAVSIKWPNDIYWGHRKVCGILLESDTSTPRAIVAGFGINVNISREQFPGDIAPIATSVLIETSKRQDTGALLSSILTSFERYLAMDIMQAHGLYTRRLYRLGDMVRVEAKQGIFETVREDGCLCLRAEGHVQYPTSGTIEFVE